jgi:hypothetical protein
MFKKRKCMNATYTPGAHTGIKMWCEMGRKLMVEAGKNMV